MASFGQVLGKFWAIIGQVFGKFLTKFGHVLGKFQKWLNIIKNGHNVQKGKKCQKMFKMVKVGEKCQKYKVK